MRSIRFPIRRPMPYTTFAALYDVLSLDWPVYGSGRRAGIEALRLASGDRVLDLGCGTGLNFRHLLRRVGPTGHVVALDSSPAMLRQAARRVRRRGWRNVTLLCADASTVDTAAWEPVDAALSTYVLSVIPDRPAAWRTMLRGTRAGGRIAIVDMQEPQGRWAVLRPLARWLCAVSSADIRARPWRLLEADLVDVRSTARRAGHIQIRAGTVPAPLEPSGPGWPRPAGLPG
jgi:S-adenosylmethionine-diacylgycerolhomoserine-N-methlytransferase